METYSFTRQRVFRQRVGMMDTLGAALGAVVAGGIALALTE